MFDLNQTNLPDQTFQTDSSFSKKERNDWAVVIPVRNRPDLLEKCLDSLRRQQFPDGRGEVLICDDGSTEGISPVVKRFTSSLPNLRLLRQPPKGPAAARNLGFRSSSAEIFVCVDSDIICVPNFLNFLVTALRKHPEWVAAEGTVLPQGSISLLHDAPEGRGGAYPSGASAYRAEALVMVGGFDETFPYPACEDIDLAARLLRIGKYGYVPEAIVYHPVRRISWKTFYNWRKFWKFVMILAERYGFLAFPGRRIGRFSRLRVALAAVVTLPGGRFLQGCGHLPKKPKEGLLACVYSFFDVICGISALPDILLANVPLVKNYLQKKGEKSA
jgi:glycosyltransferase involved in cell wall biosynthesis